jgi:deoxyadenosine/deoxycytidine kinase
MNKLIPEFKKIKVANCIAIGGMISSGKSSLIKGLESMIPNSKACYELASENGDTERAELDDILLKGLYSGKINPALFQLSFFINRFEKYKEQLTKNQDSLMLFDRTIFEDRLFAHLNMINQPILFTYYDQM